MPETPGLTIEHKIDLIRIAVLMVGRLDSDQAKDEFQKTYEILKNTISGATDQKTVK